MVVFQLMKSKRWLRILIITLNIVLTISCGGGETNTAPGVERGDNTNPARWWATEIPDLSDNPDRPVIRINGNNTISLSVDDIFEDEGATAEDLQDGDLTSEILVDNQVDTAVPGDYFVRYSVSDSSQLPAIEAVRIVRVYDEELTKLSPRPVGTTLSHLGYVEHLPFNYADNPNQKFPLLIFNHGAGSNAANLGSTPLSALSSIITNGGPPLLIHADKWHTEDSFIVLSPQMGDINQEPVERLNAFIDYAVAAYNVDISRIYVTGWSQGGFLSFAYAADYPNKVAAIVPISGGIIFGDDLREDFCEIAKVPVWAFHGEQDPVVPVAASIDSVEAINDNCLPPVAPRLTVYLGQGHTIHHDTFNLKLMENGILAVSGDPMHDLYDQSIFEWLLEHSLEVRSSP